MLRLLASVYFLVGVVVAAPQGYPAGLDPAACPNFPFCGPTPAELPNVPGAAAHAAAEQAVLAQERALIAPVLPQVPGIDAHAAAEAQVRQAQQIQTIPGLAAHAAAEAQVRLAQGDLHGLSAHALAEAQVLQAQAAVGTAFTGLVGASGNIGPSGLCGPSGCVAF